MIRMFSSVLITVALAQVPLQAQANADCSNLATGEFISSAQTSNIARSLDLGSSPNARYRIGETPLHAAARQSDSPAAIGALLAAGGNPNTRHYDCGWMPLNLAASCSGNSAVIKSMLAAGSVPNDRIKAGRTPLHSAGMHIDNPAVAEALIAGGANPSARDKRGHPPNDLAEQNGSLIGSDVYWELNEGRFRN